MGTMGRIRGLRSPDGPAGVAVEYLKSRGTIRITGWRRFGNEVDRLELPLAEFVERLEIDMTELVPARRYLLFSGSGDRPEGGMRDVAGAFDDENEARQAFHDLRGDEGSARWGELAALDARGRLVPLAWFGRDNGFPAAAGSGVRRALAESLGRRKNRRIQPLAG